MMVGKKEVVQLLSWQSDLTAKGRDEQPSYTYPACHRWSGVGQFHRTDLMSLHVGIPFRGRGENEFQNEDGLSAVASRAMFLLGLDTGGRDFLEKRTENAQPTSSGRWHDADGKHDAAEPNASWVRGPNSKRRFKRVLIPCLKVIDSFYISR